jgi:hypothetical protein
VANSLKSKLMSSDQSSDGKRDQAYKLCPAEINLLTNFITVGPISIPSIILADVDDKTFGNFFLLFSVAMQYPFHL